ncbi:hypothetical protein [Salinispora vitiensis]|uniref:hypothetical protein n=1 Tax=Salinispora vitiensis TaxID=999544 RepID=UPI00035E1AA2|nr:hypothetical protein [Salinispora vitiensis]
MEGLSAIELGPGSGRPSQAAVAAGEAPTAPLAEGRRRRGGAPQQLVGAYDRRARLGMDPSAADGPVARTSAALTLGA